ncbi:helix-turn-helix domain-containing protein [Actinomadura graeca]|uniref:Helix-turn-helix domain-containing protein n=1 Tax=Actinomadura graeca TaxID=2750812 RepID=A0ABX8QU15_9ACTN|nr:helix-turn-helix transcriptional regulator [Actinomadura graeca]QXJ22280.1 helix-turn-helix domain-containing protein [Actinomadura graeca]
MAAGAAPSVRKQRLGVALRRLREGRGLSADTAGRRLGWSASKVSRIEGARIGVDLADLRAMLRLYGADAHLGEELLVLAREAARNGWWTKYPESQLGGLGAFIALEDEASSIFAFEADTVPGLLQTEEYARQLFLGYVEIASRPRAEVERRLEIRLRRQRLIRPPERLSLCVVLDEAVLLRRVGTASTMSRQLLHLVELADLPSVTLRVLALDADHGAGLSSFILLEFEPAYGVEFPSVVHVESTESMHAQDEARVHEYGLFRRWLADHSLGERDSVAAILEAQEQWARKGRDALPAGDDGALHAPR